MNRVFVQYGKKHELSPTDPDEWQSSFVSSSKQRADFGYSRFLSLPLFLAYRHSPYAAKFCWASQAGVVRGRTLVAQRGVSASPVVERLDVLERLLFRFPAGGITRRCVHSFLRLFKKLSIGALSQQLLLRLIDGCMPYSLSSCW